MRFLSSDLLFTLEPGIAPPIPKGTLVVDQKGKILEVLPYRLDRDDLEIFTGGLCPGFINAHVHLELSHLKGQIPENTGLVDFILNIQQKRGADPEIIKNSIRKALMEMKEEGIMGFGDISNSDDSFEFKAGTSSEAGSFSSNRKDLNFKDPNRQKLSDQDFYPQNHYHQELNPLSNELEWGNFRHHTFIECFGFVNEKAEEIFSKASLLKQKAKNLGISVSTSPHAPYSVSKNLFEIIKKNEEGLQSIHNQESEAENLFFESGKGDFKRLYKTLGLNLAFFSPPEKRSLNYYFSLLGDQKKLLVHNSYSNQEDIKIGKAENTFWCLCPGANLFIEGKIPNLELFKEVFNKIVVGTDSLASNYQLSILSELKHLKKFYPEISLNQTLNWACRNGAQFFSWKELGSLEVGKIPGILNITELDKNFELTQESRVKRII